MIGLHMGVALQQFAEAARVKVEKDYAFYKDTCERVQIPAVDLETFIKARRLYNA